MAGILRSRMIQPKGCFAGGAGVPVRQVWDYRREERSMSGESCGFDGIIRAFHDEEKTLRRLAGIEEELLKNAQSSSGNLKEYIAVHHAVRKTLRQTRSLARLLRKKRQAAENLRKSGEKITETDELEE
ncbi:MAG TPA: hypothetical protein VHR42_08480 [Clostridia bacterium]|nr:hypothetical protein [Clostridia bacterium]